MKRITRAGVYAVAFLYVIAPLLVFAHATPVTYTPSAGDTTLGTPERITIDFTERIETDASGIRVFGPDGSEVQEGEAYVSSDDPRVYNVDISDIGEGIYTISWQVVSVDDGHFTKGSYSFLVDSEGKAFEGSGESVEITYVTQLPEAVLGLLSLFGESIFIGALLIYAFVARRIFRNTDKQYLKDAKERFEKLLVTIVTIGGLAFLLGTLAVIIQKAQELGVFQGQLFSEALLLYIQSSVGTQVLLKLALGLLFLGVFFKAKRNIFASDTITKSEWLLFVLLVVLIYLQSRVSHAAASFFYPDLSVFITAVHLFFKEFLVGGLILLFGLFSILLSVGVQVRALIAHTIYSKIAALSIIFAGISGAYISWLHLKRLDNLFLTEWGERFLLLIIFGLLVGVFRLLHQFFLSHRAERSNWYLEAMRVTLLLEIGVALLMLFYSGYISITTPPFSVREFSYQEVLENDGLTMRFDVHPYEEEMFRIQFGEDKPLPVDEAVVVIGNKERGIDTKVIETERRSPHSFVFLRSELSPAGLWDVDIIGKQRNEYDRNFSLKVQYPEAVLNTQRSDEQKAFDHFAIGSLVIGLLFIPIGLIMWLGARQQLHRLREENEDIPEPHPSLLFYWLMTAALFVLILLIVFIVHQRVLTSSFETQCIGDGFEWQQAFPTRNFEVVSPNAINGCFIHDGHYHVIDPKEYELVRDELI